MLTTDAATTTDTSISAWWIERVE